MGVVKNMLEKKFVVKAVYQDISTEFLENQVERVVMKRGIGVVL